MRQSQRGDEGADQARAGQVDAFAERAAQHREADAAAVAGEARQKGRPFGFVHPARLAERRNGRMLLGERARHLVEVIEAAEKRQVVARRGAVLAGDQFRDRRR